MLRNILNTSWVSPFTVLWGTAMEQLGLMLFLMFVTIIIETSVAYLVARRKGYKDVEDLILAVLLANMLTGLLGIVVNVWLAVQ